ncbi:MAG: response regulator [Pseudozobellia sp.]|nr:response regulator [Pseudozobellia sp.]|tara:strand:+ start:70 stop:462 length:393 start_codon:yes stop_codon:yes gene_type:complete
MDLRVLIVEDNFIIQMFLESGITALGHEVIGALDLGNDVLTFLESEKPNLILLDIGLTGELSGIDLGEIIDKKYHIPFVYLTGNSDKPTLARAMATKPLHIIKKPIDEDKLKKEIGLIIEKISSSDILSN